MHINKTTKLKLSSELPLTCTRIGTCCHGNQVLMNPWELFVIANEKHISAKEFRDLYCDLGGIRLKFNGTADSRGKKACSQYIDGFGCSVHLGRPLPCRLFPLGRQVQNNEIHYIHEGDSFPCLNGCPEVVDLPTLTVGEYLNGQETAVYEKAQGVYLELMQDIADIAFELLLDSGLSESGDTKTILMWREMAHESPENLVSRIGGEWIDLLLIPYLNDQEHDVFTAKHKELILDKVQKEFGQIQTMDEFSNASGVVMSLAIHLARALGTNVESLTEHWIEIAKKNGAVE